MKQPDAKREVARILGKKLKHSNGWVGLAKNIHPSVRGKKWAKAVVINFLAIHAKKQTPTKLSSQRFYISREWRRVRYQALKKHGAKCQCCGMSPSKHGIVLHVDHVKPRSKYPALELELSNLQVLCEDCNLGKSNIDVTDWRTTNELVRLVS